MVNPVSLTDLELLDAVREARKAPRKADGSYDAQTLALVQELSERMGEDR